MATSDIDTQSIVGKYISRQTTGVRLNADSDTAEENQAVLESIAIAFSLNPQAALSIILRAKNSFQQLIQADIQLIDYITAAIRETQNPDAFPSSTADLVDAQTALVELDRIGRVDTNLQAFTRYQNSINNFLNNHLAPLLKRTPNGTFNRAGIEAKQDLFNALSLFVQTHQLLSTRLKELANAVADFGSVDLSKVVHTQTIARVRTSLSQIKVGMDTGAMSNTVAALELLAGTASLQSISNALGVYDPTIETGLIPVGNTYQIAPEPTAAFEDSAAGPLLSTAALTWNLTLAIDGGGPTTHELPKTGFTGRPFVVNAQDGPYTIPASRSLYVEIDGTTLYSIPLTAGVRSAAQVITDLNAVLAGGSVAADFDTAIQRIIIAGSNANTTVRILPSGPGTFVPGTGAFTPDPLSGHKALGFADNQLSDAVGSFDFPFLQLFFRAMFPTVSTAVLNSGAGPLRVTSGNTNPAISALNFSGAVAADFGFPAGPVLAIPLAMLITDTTGATFEPTGLGLLVGSIVHATYPSTVTFIQPITGFDGNRVLFGAALPVIPSTSITVVAPTVAAVQSVMSYLGNVENILDSDILPLQSLMSPLLSTPSLAQVNDALKAFKVIRAKLTNSNLTGLLDRLSVVVVSESQQPADATAEMALQTLEERGMDSAFDLLSQCLFSDFFALTSETVSKSTNFMKTMETVMTTDLPTTTVEQDMPDGNLLSGLNPSSVLTDKEVP